MLIDEFDDFGCGRFAPSTAAPHSPLNCALVPVALTNPGAPGAPTVLVYEPPRLSVTEVPTVSVSWDRTNRCDVPICSLAAFASSALPRRMKAVTALPESWSGR